MAQRGAGPTIGYTPIQSVAHQDHARRWIAPERVTLLDAEDLLRTLLLITLIGCADSTQVPQECPPAPAAIGTTLQAVGGDAVLASWSGGEIRDSHVEARVGHDARNKKIKFLLEEHELKTQALEALIVDELLRAEVQRRGLPDVDALLRKEVESKIREPSPQEIEDYYPIVARQLRGMDKDEAQPYVEAELIRQAQQRRYNTFIEELRSAAQVQINLPYPDLPRVDVPISPSDPARGPHDAPITLVQFAEYQCYYCNKAHPTLNALLDEYPDQIRMIWKGRDL